MYQQHISHIFSSFTELKVNRDLWHTFSLFLYFHSLPKPRPVLYPCVWNAILPTHRQVKTKTRSRGVEAQRAEVGKAGGNLSAAHFRSVIAREPSLPIIRHSREEQSSCMHCQWKCKQIHLPEGKPLSSAYQNLKRHVRFGQQVYSLAITQDRYPHTMQKWHLNKDSHTALVCINHIKVHQ